MSQDFRKKSLIFILFGLFFTNLIHLEIANALDLTAPMVFESARVLPPGVRNPRFMNVFMSIDSRFNGGGGREPLGTPLNKTVSWGEVMNVQDNEIDKVFIRSTLDDTHLNSDGSPGSTTGQVNSYFNIKVPVLAVGVTNRLTVGFALPIIYASISADSGFSKSDDGQVFMNKVCNLSVEKCNTAAKKMNNAVNEKLARNGYRSIHSKTVSNVGDLQVVSKYMVHEDSMSRIAVKSTLVLPTGVKPNPDDVLDIPTGDGRFSVGAAVVYDRTFLKDFTWNTYGGVLGLMPNRMDKRVPVATDDPISSDKESLVRKMGGLVSVGTSLIRQFSPTGFVAGAGYSFQFQTKARYSGGTQFSADRYALLEDLKPAQALHSTMLMAGFSTVEWYQNKKFFYPLQANLVFSHPVLGRNVTANDVISGELVLFF